MIWWIANLLLGSGSIIDVLAVYKQIQKTLRTKDSTDVSTSFYNLKLIKDILIALGLAIYSNWVGILVMIPGFVAYLYEYMLVIKYKPTSWTPNKVEDMIRRIQDDKGC